MPENYQQYQEKSSHWFQELQQKICHKIENYESLFIKKGLKAKEKPKKFTAKTWKRTDPLLPPGTAAGGGEMRILKGHLFEKAGVNFSAVYGLFSEDFRRQIPGAEKDGKFWASGISVVIHPYSPFIPTVHMNTRMIVTSNKTWFGGGADITPMTADFTINQPEIHRFHQVLEGICNRHNEDYYVRFKKACDDYFFIKHRSEARGAGGIFYDYLNTGNPEQDFAFTKDVGVGFLEVYSEIIEKLMDLEWEEQHRQEQLIRRGRYVEFNLLYDRGTIFGLKTDGNVEAILMSLPPLVSWP
ncbi:MAG: oxygen-dependent coproporphyrinogen oxidase [Rhodospirillaceae bacterium]|nr:oxygen-dependent coproporphyrinogen oxidase [Rhodospirillaceae bacterium]